jgi:hypothetical protein
MTAELLFVYNADSGLYNTLSDIAHKLLSPATYSCSLCSITHGVFSEREDWRQFIESLPVSSEFLHRDDFKQRYPEWVHLDLPVLLLLRDKEVSVLLDQERIAACQSVEELSVSIQQKLAEQNIRPEGH